MATISFVRKPTEGLVSIVIPTYCAERFIGETLATVSRQTYTNWEVIVVEDASCGATQQIVEDFARQHPSHRVEYSRNDQNCGPSHSRNVAFATAGGEFVALLDSDDRWLPDHLSASVEALEKSGKDIAYSSVVFIDDQTELLLGIWGPSPYDLTDFPKGLFRRNFITPSATVLRRQVLADVGTWDTQLRYCEDLEYWLRCLAAGKTFQRVGGCHCLYRRNHAGTATNKNCAVREAFAQVIERYIGLPGLREEDCRRFASMAYRLAAHLHATTNPLWDPSADPSRAASLIMQAWRLRPKHLDYLWKAARFSLANLIRRRVRSAPSPVEEVPKRAAA